jgi:hypothetical protein
MKAAIFKTRNTRGRNDKCIQYFLRTGRDEPKRKTQERMKRKSRKKSSSAGSEKTERVSDR